MTTATNAATVAPSDIPAIRSALLRYRIMAYVVGVLLVVLVCVGLPLKYIWGDGRVVVWGTNDRTEEKAAKLAALLTQPGRTYDVSSPDLPTVK